MSEYNFHIERGQIWKCDRLAVDSGKVPVEIIID